MTKNHQKKPTPAEYYGGQLDQSQILADLLEFENDPYPYLDSVKSSIEKPAKYIVGCDWLELHLKGDLCYMSNNDHYEKGSFSFVSAGIRSKHYSASHTVYYRGELFGVVLHQPRAAVLSPDSINFKIDNQQLYKRRGIDLKIAEFLKTFEIQFCNYTRVDLYIDFNRFNDRLQFSDFVTAYSAGYIESKGKVQSFNKFHTKINGEMTLTGFSYGSRSSDKYIRCYDKTIELERSHKSYIKEYWKQNGFDPSETVYRFEVQLNSKFFRKTRGERMKIGSKGNQRAWEVENKRFSISHPDSVLSLLQLATNNYFDFFVQDSGRVRNDSKLPFEVFNWQKLREGVKKLYNYVREKIEHKAITWRQKMIVARNMFREYVVNKQEDQWLFFVARIVHDYQLRHRWDKMVERYVIEFHKTVGEYYAFDWNKLQNSFNAMMAKIRFYGMQGTQAQLL